MCGITGFFDLTTQWGDEKLTTVVNAMAETIRHRGPDDGGSWVDPAHGVALGFRRLAILDLSPTGHQPMHSADGRYTIVFNGEIYNFAELRQQLIPLGHGFQGGSDTEVILAAFCQWGVAHALEHFNGMFAFAVWDHQNRQLTLARDRLGVKPLYYGWIQRTLVFASELKPIRAFPGFNQPVNRQALALFLRHNYIPAPYSIYEGINKLPQGAFVTFDPEDNAQDAQPQYYWQARTIAEQGTRDPFLGSAGEARDALDTLLRDSIRLRMVADVPLGAFLSGGIDSSTIVALMQAQSDRPIKTFTIGFWEEGYNEAIHAKQVAQHLGTDHTELYVTPRDALDVIPRLPTLYDEPFSDSSQIPTFLVSELTRRHVTVSLSGDGGDELFAGYNRYAWGKRLWRRLSLAPSGIRQGMGSLVTAIPPSSWDALFKRFSFLLPKQDRFSNAGDKMHKIAEVLSVAGKEELYLRLISHWKSPDKVVLQTKEPLTVMTDRSQWPELGDFTLWMMYLDLISYLPDDILVKVDRASMGVSLEARVPFLDDHRVVEFAWRLPLGLKERDGVSKWILRQVLYQYVPPEMVERPKMGFGVPIDSWLRGELRPWAENLLDERRLRDEQFFDPAPIRQKWAEHLEGKRNWQYYLWDILMFEAWMEANVSAH